MDNYENENNTITICINSEIRDYTEDMFWGLSLRQFLFSAMGCAVSVLIYFLLHGVFGVEAVSWACILGMFPCAVLGFVKYNGMPAEQLILAIIRSMVLTPRQLKFKSVNLFEECLKEGKRKGLRKFESKENKKEKEEPAESSQDSAGKYSGTENL